MHESILAQYNNSFDIRVDVENRQLLMRASLHLGQLFRITRGTD